MEIKLIDGRFTIEEAEKLLTAIFQTKIAFHEQKIRTVHHTEEDIEQSEKRIMQLEESLRSAIRRMKSKGQIHTSLHAHIEVNTIEQLTP